MDIGKMINDDAGTDSRRTSVKSLLNSPPVGLPASDDSKASSTSDLAHELSREMEYQENEENRENDRNDSDGHYDDNHRSSRKPRRYSRPPVWALRWTGQGRAQTERPAAREPPQQQQRAPPASQADHGAGFQSSRPPAARPVAMSSASATGCPPSISGIKPFESVTRTVTSWLHAHLHGMSPEQRKTVELEAKIGTIQHKKVGAERTRLSLPIITEAVLDQQYAQVNCAFVSSLPESLLEEAKRVLDAADPALIRSTEHTIHRDEIYEGDKQEKQDEGNLRVTKDDVTGRQVTKIRKKAIAHMMIHCPTEPFDVRLSISTEKPCDDAPSGPCRTRRKDRISYIYDGFRADLTKVSGSSTSSELELECDTSRLVGYFEDKNDDKNMDKVEELLQILLDSVRFVNRRLKG